MTPRMTAAMKELEEALAASMLHGDRDTVLHSWTLFAFNGAGRVSVINGGCDCANCREAIAKVAVTRAGEGETAAASSVH